MVLPSRLLVAWLVVSVGLLGGCHRRAEKKDTPALGSATPKLVPTAPSTPRTPPAASATSFPGATCADIVSRDVSFRGFAPKGVSKELLFHAAQSGVHKTTAAPFVWDGQLLFLESLRDGVFKVTRAVSPTERELVKEIPLKGKDIPRSDVPMIAVGDKTLGVSVIYGKQAYLVLIDPRAWTVSRMIELKIAPPETIMSIEQQAIGFGDGKFGILFGSLSRTNVGKSGAVWTVYDEKGTEILPPTIFSGRPNRYSPREVLWAGSSFVAFGARESQAEYAVGLYALPAKTGDIQFFPWIEPDPGIVGRRQARVSGAARVTDDMVHVAIERSHGTERELLIAHGTPSGKLTLETCPK